MAPSLTLAGCPHLFQPLTVLLKHFQSGKEGMDFTPRMDSQVMGPPSVFLRPEIQPNTEYSRLDSSMDIFIEVIPCHGQYPAIINSKSTPDHLKKHRGWFGMPNFPLAENPGEKVADPDPFQCPADQRGIGIGTVRGQRQPVFQVERFSRFLESRAETDRRPIGHRSGVFGVIDHDGIAPIEQQTEPSAH